MRYLAQLIEKSKKQQGKSLRDIAAHSGVGRDTVAKIINNPNRIPELVTLNALSRSLNIPLRNLIESCGFDLTEYDPALAVQYKCTSCYISATTKDTTQD